MDMHVEDKTAQVFLQQLFQFWYNASMLPSLGLNEANMSGGVTRLLRIIEKGNFEENFPIGDISEAGWSLKNTLLDSMDKVEGHLQLTRPSSPSIAGRVVEITIAVSKKAAQITSQAAVASAPLGAGPPPPPWAAPGMPGRGYVCGMTGPLPPGNPYRPPSYYSAYNAMTAGRGPTTIGDGGFNTGMSDMRALSLAGQFLEMREEYFSGAFNAASLTADQLIETLSKIAPEATFQYAHPVRTANIPILVSVLAGWGLGSRAMQIPPAHLSAIVYKDMVGVLVLSGSALYRSAMVPSRALPFPPPMPRFPPAHMGTVPPCPPWKTGGPGIYRPGPLPLARNRRTSDRDSDSASDSDDSLRSHRKSKKKSCSCCSGSSKKKTKHNKKRGKTNRKQLGYDNMLLSDSDSGSDSDKSHDVHSDSDSDSGSDSDATASTRSGAASGTDSDSDAFSDAEATKKSKVHKDKSKKVKKGLCGKCRETLRDFVVVKA